jgi:hypothetical protein
MVHAPNLSHRHSTQVPEGLIIKTYIVPVMWVGMEVWSPRTPDEKRGVAGLDGVLVDALLELLGIPRSHPVSYSWRNCKATVLLCLLASLA